LAAFAEAVADVLKVYVKPNAPLARAISAPARPGIHNDFLRAALDCFQRRASEPSQIRLLIETDRPTRSKNDRIRRSREALFPDQGLPPHPLFPSRPLFDPVLLQAEFLPIRIEDSLDPVTSNCDLYAVLREARGWTSPDPAETNILVRDLLWIRRSEEPREHRDLTEVEGGDHPIGIYISAIDRSCLFVEKIDRDGPNVMLTACSGNASRYDQRMTMIFAGRGSRQPLRIRHGVLSGSAGADNNLAAWKCLIVRPEWPFFF
jgi:hypothetical protein